MLARLQAAWQHAGAAGSAWAAALQPGLAAADARRLLGPWAGKVPPEVLHLWTWGNGFRDERALIPGGRWPGLDAAMQAHAQQVALARGVTETSGGDPADVWLPTWLPLLAAEPALGEGAWWVLVPPGRGQSTASVWFKDPQDAPVLAFDSLLTLFATAAECLERGAWALRGDAVVVVDDSAAAEAFRTHNPRAAGAAAAGEEAAAVVARLLDALARGGPRERGEAAALLIKRRDRQALPGLVALVATADAGVRVFAARALEALRDRRAVPALLPCLEHPDLQVRNHAALALAAIGDRSAVPGLMAALRRSRPMELAGLARALATFNEAQALEVLAPLLQPGQPAPVRYGVLGAIGAMTVPELPGLLLPLLVDADPQVRAAAVSGLGKPGCTDAVAPLLACLNDTAWPVRLVAASALASVGDAGAIPGLQQALERAAPGTDAAAPGMHRAFCSALESAIATLRKPAPR